MELEGNLNSFSLPDVLKFLATGRMTGELTVQRTDSEICLEIRGGRIVNSSTINRPFKLGEMLVQRGVIPRSDLDEALKAQRQSSEEKLIGELLIERGAITQEQVNSAIQLQLEEEIWDLFTWQEGDFKFEHKEIISGPLNPIEIDIESLLVQRARRMSEWETILTSVKSDETIFAPSAPARGRLHELTLTEREWTVLSLVNGYFNVGSLIARSGFGTFETYRILNTLLAAGLIAESSPSSARVPSALVRESERDSSHESAPQEETPSGRFRRIGALLALGRSADSLSGNGSGGTSVAELGKEEDYVSPVGLTAACLNDLTKALMANPEFRAAEPDRTLLSELWFEIVNICPKADLMKAGGNQLDASEFEVFFRMVENESELQGCYEDAMEGMSRLTARLRRIAAQRMGEEETQRLFAEAGKRWGACRPMILHCDFCAGEFLQKAAG